MKELSLMSTDELYLYNKKHITGDAYKTSANNIVKEAFKNNKHIHRTLIHSGIGGFNPLYEKSHSDMINAGYSLVDDLYIKE